jgi:hypothetical protein
MDDAAVRLFCVMPYLQAWDGSGEASVRAGVPATSELAVEPNRRLLALRSVVVENRRNIFIMPLDHRAWPPALPQPHPCGGCTDPPNAGTGRRGWTVSVARSGRESRNTNRCGQ